MPSALRTAANLRALLGLSFTAGYLATYFLSTAIPTRLFWYYPLQHRFELEVHPTALAMDFYGRVLLSLIGGGAAFLLMRLLLRKSPSLIRIDVVHGLLVAVIGLLLFTGGLYIFLLAHRVPIPVLLPPGYVPR